ncbi:MAG TPA: hypothetical protein V6D29_13640 [Leptolyngbyaceae cyanobacterium]
MRVYTLRRVEVYVTWEDNIEMEPERAAQIKKLLPPTVAFEDENEEYSLDEGDFVEFYVGDSPWVFTVERIDRVDDQFYYDVMLIKPWRAIPVADGVLVATTEEPDQWQGDTEVIEAFTQKFPELSISAREDDCWEWQFRDARSSDNKPEGFETSSGAAADFAVYFAKMSARECCDRRV